MSKVLAFQFLAAFAQATTACAAAADSDRTVCPDRADHTYYFSAGTINPSNDRSDSFVRGWYSKQLIAMGEPSISCGSPGEVYRFTWLRTFHHPVVVRVTNHGDHVVLQATELDGAGGYEPGKVLRQTQRTLSSKEFDSLTTAFSKEKFSVIPTAEERGGLDGAEWIVEMSSASTYHLVVRWSPDSGPIREIGSQFLALTKWKFDDVY